jgi:DNA-binding beta-propeller fold protein YncE
LRRFRSRRNSRFTRLTGSVTYTGGLIAPEPQPRSNSHDPIPLGRRRHRAPRSAVAQAQTFKVAKYNIGGDGGTDYVTAEAGTGRVFVSRGTHVMVVDGPTGKVLGDIPDTPRMHGVGIAPKHNHGFTTNAGDSTVTMFDLKTLAVIKKIPVKVGGLDGIMYDDYSDRIILTNHSRPIGTAVALDANTGDIVGTAELEDNAPEGAASDGKGKLFVNNEGKNTIQVLDAKSMKVLASWPIAPCDGPYWHRVRSCDEPHLLRLREDVGGRRREDGEGRRDHHERGRRRRTRLGSQRRS